jgi:hypothetical protein
MYAEARKIALMGRGHLSPDGFIRRELATWRYQNQLMISERVFAQAIEAASLKRSVWIALRRFSLVATVLSIATIGVWGLVQSPGPN